MPTKKINHPVKLSPEKQKLANAILQWSRMVNDPTKEKESEALFRKIWDMRHGKIRPF